MVCYCKQKTAYEMRISDWSSDVCSSDLLAAPDRRHRRAARRNRDRIDVERDGDIGQRHHRLIGEIARTEQALFLGRRREEIDVAVGPRALAQPLCDLDPHRDPARLIDRAVDDAFALAPRRTAAEMSTEERTVG